MSISTKMTLVFTSDANVGDGPDGIGQRQHQRHQSASLTSHRHPD